MKQMTVSPAADRPRWGKYLIPAVVLVVVGLVGFFAYRGLNTRQAASVPPSTALISEHTLISQSTLEEQYGLRVSLIAVTAAGGLVDLRLKILDAEKARHLLRGSTDFPALVVDGIAAVLTASGDSQAQDLKLEDGGNVFVLFPNTQNAVKAGTPVGIVFGRIWLEPIMAK